MSRIFPSRIVSAEGKDYDTSPELLGQLQPYSIYEPTTYDASVPTPLMLDLHSLGEHHWQYNGSTGVQLLAPISDDVTAGLRRVHAIAIWARDCPRACAISFSF